MVLKKSAERCETSLISSLRCPLLSWLGGLKHAGLPAQTSGLGWAVFTSAFSEALWPCVPGDLSRLGLSACWEARM